ncbi:RHS repeat protein [Aquimarina sp. MMG015]|uniref:RHS repeat protein n=1 Tax=Aquimarina sp. MMG015 TaxID=2822689 RepID=UPI001B3A1B30|nr:RHS repeat protein [Aquimarina sp. MMG015]MBQ4804097.1 RHS repeat protein [Aquimarina sp. MMG015]
MNTLKNIVATIALCFGFYHVSGQEIPLTDNLPPSPEVASLGQYIDTPVSLFTGIPSVGIPICNIEQKRFTVPISLSYHAGGVTLDQISSRVGLGWSLNAGGMISRQKRQLPDDIPFGYLNTQSNLTVETLRERLPFNLNEEKEEILEYLNQRRDYEPDIFNFNFLGYSGSFYFDQKTNIPVFEEHSNLKVEPIFSIPDDIGYNVITSFKVTNEKGIEFYFGDAENPEDHSVEIRGGIDTEYVFSYRNYGVSNSNTSEPQETRKNIAAWYLKRIFDPITEESVNFNYDLNTSVRTIQRISEEKEIVHMLNSATSPNTLCRIPRSGINHSFLESLYDEVWLREIIFDQGKVVFTQSSDFREDLYRSKALEQIELYDQHDKKIKHFKLNHFYEQNSNLGWYKFDFKGYPFYIGDDMTDAFRNATKRLFLESIDQYEINSDNTIDTNNYQRHSFDYIQPDKLPHRFSTAQDYWGYHNGKNSNEDLIATAIFKHNQNGFYNQTTLETVGEADRNVNEEASQYGTLNKITYPTGGSKTYIYESNRVKKTPDLGVIVENDELVKKSYFFTDLQTENQVTLDAPQYLKYEFVFDLQLEQQVEFHINIPCAADENEPDDCPWIMILTNHEDTPTSIDVAWVGDDKTRSYSLEAGRYFLTAVRGIQTVGSSPPDLTRYDGVPLFEVYTTVWETINNNNTNQFEEVLTGGLRVKEILFETESDHDLISTKYEYEFSNGEPSGKLASIPYFRGLTTGTGCALINSTGTGPAQFVHERHKYTSNSSVSLAKPNGSYTGYRMVTEYQGNKENGKTEYQYGMVVDPIYLREFPFPPAYNLDPLRGDLLSKITYRNQDGDFIKEEEEKNYYSTVNPHIQQAYKIGILYDQTIPEGLIGRVIKPVYLEYELTSFWNVLNSNVKIKYDPETNESMKDSTVYRYNSNTLNQTRISKYISSYSNTFAYQTVDNYYPDDIDALSSFNIPDEQRPLIETLNRTNQNRISELVLTENKGWGSLESKKIIRFKEYSNNRVLPEYAEIYKEGYGTFITGKVLQYDDDLNPIEVQEKENSPITSYIWGYQGQYPIAVLKNIAYNDIPENTITTLKNLSNADNDRCTENICAEQELREALSTLINDFPNGMITTFTYDTLIGTTSTTDPKGYTSYYVYDGYNRLQYIKDAEGNVLQEYEYNYKNQ